MSNELDLLKEKTKLLSMRFNPNHGKDGKFAPGSSGGNGGSGGSGGEGDGSYGQNELGHKYTKEEYEARLRKLNKYDKYHYHATTMSALKGIKEEGLVPHVGHSGEEVYMAKTKQSALEWTADTSTGGTVVMRVSNKYLAKTDYMDYDDTKNGEGSMSTIIPVKEIQVETSAGQWIPVKDAVISYNRGKPSIIKRPKGV